jgi:hypothetical protein
LTKRLTGTAALISRRLHSLIKTIQGNDTWLQILFI